MSVRASCAVVSLLLGSGCVSMYGTPAEREAKISATSSYSLCSKLVKAQLAPSEVREGWARELQQRGENCSQYVSTIAAEAQANQQQLNLGLQMLSSPAQSPPPPPVGGGSAAGTAFFVRSQVSGMNRVCIYNRLGSAVAITVGAAELCPLSLP
jgi:hypothetical protein